MLRNKIAKMLVGITTAVVLSTGVFSFGELVHAETNGTITKAVGQASRQIRTVEQLKAFLANAEEDTATIAEEIELTKESIADINKLTTPKTLIVNENGSLKVTESAEINNNGNFIVKRGTSTKALLTIGDKTEEVPPTEGTQKPGDGSGGDVSGGGEGTGTGGGTGTPAGDQKPQDSTPLIPLAPSTPIEKPNVDAQQPPKDDVDQTPAQKDEVKPEEHTSTYVGEPAETASATIKGFIFDNSMKSNVAAISNSSKTIKTVNLTGNTLKGGGYLVETKEGFTFNFSGNTLEDGAKLDEKAVDLDLFSPSFSVIGGTLTASGEVKFVQANANPNFVKGYIVATNIKNNNDVKSGELTLKNENNSKSFTGKVPGLTSTETYTVTVVLIDDKGNGSAKEFNKVKGDDELKLSVSNVTSNGADFTFDSKLIDTNTLRFPLSFEVTEGNNTQRYSIADANELKKITTFSLTKLLSNTKYTAKVLDYYGNVVAESIFTTSYNGSVNGGSGTITGTGGTSSSFGDISSSDINKSTINDIDASINVGSSSLSSSLRDGSDYTTNYEGVTASYVNGKLELTGLVPGKEYKDLTVTYRDRNSNNKTVRIPRFKTTEAATKLRQFIVDVYKYSLDREADERGFAYWENELKNHRVMADLFVRNLLNEKEFVSKHSTTTDKIKGLYQVIVNREADTQGLNFWSAKYTEFVRYGYSESLALDMVAAQMVNENEFKNRVSSLGI